MNDEHEQDRQEWIKGQQPGDTADEFARHAARGRQELDGEDDAASLMAELDGLIAQRYDEGAAAGEEKKQKSRGGATVRRLRKRYAVAVAILLLLVAGTWWLRQPAAGFNAEDAYLAAFEPYANDLASRPMGGPNEVDSLPPPLAAASRAYDRRAYAAAADSFARVFNPASAPPVSPVTMAATEKTAARLYYGISLLAANRPDEAATVLSSLRNDPAYGPPATWYLALAQLRREKPAVARETLQNISQDSPFHGRALKLLDVIP